ncbi:hypothetical protein HYW53_00345 [Candidatus Giovannonibacteria bacterium]|nr:hypothetical protein [Candidatus Giovannonibacteria bacterium]
MDQNINARTNQFYTRLLIILAIVLILVITATALLFKGSDRLRQLGSSFVSLFSRKVTEKQELILKAEPMQVKSGENFRLSYEHRGKKEDGSYTLSFQCAEDLKLMLDTGEPVFCSRPLDLTVAELTLKASSTKTGFSELPIRLEFQSAATSTSDQVIVRIERESNKTTGGTNAQTGTSTPPKQTTTNPPKVVVGQPKTIYNNEPIRDPSHVDLDLKIIDRGVVNPTTGVFTSKSTVASGERAAVVFDVQNNGGVPSGPWFLYARLPISDKNFTSSVQPSLKPGDKIRFTMGFGDLLNSGPNDVSFSANIQIRLLESNFINNTATTSVNRGF